MLKHLSKGLIAVSLSCFVFNDSYSQGQSVFSANYFNKDEADPPIKPGKGFNILDVYKQTRYCFTPESINQSSFKPLQNAKKTAITIHYTKDEEEFNLLKTKGASGKISYLNLFSLGGSKLQSFSSSSYDRVERLVLLAKVDFGVYSYDHDPVLSDDSKSLIDQGKHDDFINFYGTHYISGVRKESSIWVVLTKKDNSYKGSTSDQNTVSAGFQTPFKVGGNFELTDGTQTDNFLSSSEYDISIEVNGPSFDKDDLQGGINKILKTNDGSDKISGIKKLIGGVLNNLSDPNQGIITQYYFTPFTLYGVNNINWDEQKENNLIQINEAVINVSNTKSVIDKLILPNGLNDIQADFDTDLSSFSKKDDYKLKLQQTYNNILPNLKSYKKQLDTTIVSLQRYYTKCSDIHCVSSTNCCAYSQMNDKVNLLMIKVDNEISKLSKIKDNAWMDAANEELTQELTPECQKEKIGYLTVVNKSTNPYDFYQGDQFIQTLSGGSVTKFKVGVGNRFFKASQQSGYLMYPTVNNRSVTITNYCDEVTINIGFED